MPQRNLATIRLCVFPRIWANSHMIIAGQYEAPVDAMLLELFVYMNLAACTGSN
jgi:hypothetical protein